MRERNDPWESFGYWAAKILFLAALAAIFLYSL